MVQVTTWSKLTDLSHTSCPPEWNQPARQNRMYWLSSCAISLLGLMMFLHEWPMVGLMVLFQSFASYCADVYCIGRRSIVHGIDHWAAVLTSLMFGYYFTFSVKECVSSHQKQRAACLVGLAVCLGASAVASKICSMRAQRRQDMASYFTYHACWHYAIASCCVLPLMSCGL